MPVEKIANVLEMDAQTVRLWLDDEGIDPKDYRDMTYQCQLDGIAAAKAKGVKFGRPRVEPPDNFAEIVSVLESKAITTREAIKRSGMTEATFYRRLREYRKKRSENV